MYIPCRGHPDFLSWLSTIAAGVKATRYSVPTNAVQLDISQKLFDGAPRCKTWRNESTLKIFMAAVDYIRVGRRWAERCTVCHCLRSQWFKFRSEW